MAGAQTPAPGSLSAGCVGLEAQVEPTSVQEVRTYNIYVCAHTHTVHTHANTHTCAHTHINIHGHAHSTGRLGSTVLTHKHSSLRLSSPPAAQETKHKCVTQNCRGRPYSTSLSGQRIHPSVTVCMTTPELHLIFSLKQSLSYNLELRFQNQNATVGQPAFRAFDFLWLSE